MPYGCRRLTGPTRRRLPPTSARGTKRDTAIADFSKRYADQNDIDYQAFVDAVRTGRIPAVEGL